MVKIYNNYNSIKRKMKFNFALVALIAATNAIKLDVEAFA